MSDDLSEMVSRWVAEGQGRQGLLDDARRLATIVDDLLAGRRAADLSQAQVAERMGVKQPTVSQFEAESSDPHLSTLQRYARAVGGRIEINYVAEMQS